LTGKFEIQVEPDLTHFSFLILFCHSRLTGVEVKAGNTINNNEYSGWLRKASELKEKNGNYCRIGYPYITEFCIDVKSKEMPLT